MDDKEMIKKGKGIINLIATFYILLSIVTFFTEFNLIKLILQIAVAITLYAGIFWLKYVYAAASAVGALTIGFVLLFIDYGLMRAESTMYVFLTMTYLIALLIFYIGSSIVLFSNKNVSAYFKRRKKSLPLQLFRKQGE